MGSCNLRTALLGGVARLYAKRLLTLFMQNHWGAMRTHQLLASVSAVALVTTGLVAGGGVTAAVADVPANPTPSCVVSDTPGQLDCTVSYASTGAEQTFVVPVGVTSVEVELLGGRGGSSMGTSGGRGDRVTGSVDVTAESTLYVYVAGNGTQNAGGYNGGGSPGAPANRSSMAGGGGATDLRTASDLTSRLAVAGGGGGAVAGYEGGDAQQPGDSFLDLPENLAQPGSQTAGGVGGVAAPGLLLNSGAPGTLGFGGAGGDYRAPGNPTGGGGGGGGFYGGGGGLSNDSGSGAGGSSLVPDGGSSAPSDQAPAARITYEVPIEAVTVEAEDDVRARQQMNVTILGYGSGLSASIASKVVSAIAIAAQGAGTDVSDVSCETANGTMSCTSTRAGEYIVQLSFGGWYSNVITFGARFTSLTQTIDFTGGSSSVQQPTPLVATATSGLPVSYTLDSGPCTLNGSTLAATGSGTCIVTASQPGSNPYLAAESVTRSFTATPPMAPPAVPSNGNLNSLANTGQANGTGVMAVVAALALIVLGAGLILVRRKTGSAGC